MQDFDSEHGSDLVPAGWATAFPRLFDLYRASDRTDPQNYFLQWGVMNALVTQRQTAVAHETELQQVHDAAWEEFKRKAQRYTAVRHKQRDYAQLFDCFNEIKGYLYLRSEGYDEIHFMEEVDTRTPDLRATRGTSVALLEVKTIHESDDECAYFAADPKTRDAKKVEHALPDMLKSKLRKTIPHARRQLLEYQDSAAERRIIYLVIRIDFHYRIEDELASFINQQADSQAEVVHVMLNERGR